MTSLYLHKKRDAIKYYALERITKNLIRVCEKNIFQTEKLREQGLFPESQKYQSMARVYLIAAIMELEKTLLAEQKRMFHNSLN